MPRLPLRGAAPSAAAALLVILAVTADAAEAATAADSSDDFCAANADPCTVTKAYDVVPGTVLDFGRRAFVLTGSGQLNFASGDAEILAGSVTIGGQGILAKAGSAGGNVSILARRACSQDATRLCTTDRECDLGTCGLEGSCSRRPSVACAVDDDCYFGTCSVGTGSIAIQSLWEGRTATPGSATIVAADGVTVAATMDLGGNTNESSGGEISIESEFGSVVIAGQLQVPGGLLGAGGSVLVYGAEDVSISAAINGVGGDEDGASVEVEAGRDVSVTADINCSASGGSGYGGSVDLTAGRDLYLGGGGSADRTEIVATGNQSIEKDGGDGGDFSFSAGRNLTVDRWVKILSQGAKTDGYGGELSFDADGDIRIVGAIESKADGIDGDGGYVTLSAFGNVLVEPTGSFSVDGGNPGSLEIEADFDVDLAGSISMIGRRASSFGGVFSILSFGNVTLRGSLTASKSTENEVEIEACRISMKSGANFNNDSTDGSNTLTVYESMRLESGSSLKTKSGGQNLLIHRTALKPPVVLGTVSPAPVVEEAPYLFGCPVCGNGEVDEGESCDDGNTTSDATCSGDCQLQSCIAATVGAYPEAPLCNDDRACTVDLCDSAVGACTHTVACDDGVACTDDVCPGSECESVPSDAACSDDLFCNGTETCDSALGCQAGEPPDCADEVACTVDACNEVADLCIHAPDDAACDDGDECTLDTCSAAAGCQWTASGTPACSGTTTTTLPALLCGDANGNGVIQASDALLTLRTVVGTASCLLALCDVNADGVVRASDALAILRKAVGQDIELVCSAAALVVESAPSSTTTTTQADPEAPGDLGPSPR